MPQILGKEVGQGDQATGFGLMGLTWRDDPTPYPSAFKTMKTALSNGANLWNGGELYGPPTANSLQLLAAYFTEYPADADKVVISIKGGLNPETHGPDGSAGNVRRSVDECLRVLDGKKFLDIFECARVDPKTPVEETIETLARYVEDGKLGGISLSECGPDTIRRAAKVHKIVAVEVEFSLFSLEILTNGVAQACKENDIPIIAYSPLGRGMLTGKYKTKEEMFAKSPFFASIPRFQDGAFEHNMKLVDEVEKVAKNKGCSPGQVAIAWVMAHSGRDGMPVIIPIPGATTEKRVEENMKAVVLTEEEVGELDGIAKGFEVKGGRYGGPLASLEYGESPERKA